MVQIKRKGKYPDVKGTMDEFLDKLEMGGIKAPQPVQEVEVVVAQPKEPTMSSREIADLTGKRHDNVLADCDKLNESYSKLTLPEISVGVYFHPNTGNQQHREMLLTKMQTFDLMTGYSQELRIKVNRRWAELEEKERQQFVIPKTFSEALMLAAKQQEQIELQSKQLEEQRHNPFLLSYLSCL